MGDCPERDFCDVLVRFFNTVHFKLLKILYHVLRQSSRCLYEDAEFNVRAEGEDGKTASEYSTYDTLSQIGKRKREFVCQGAEVELRLIRGNIADAC